MAILIGSFVYVPIIFVVVEVLDETAMSFFEYCKNGTTSSKPSPILQLAFSLPNLVYSGLPVVFDLRTYRYIHSHTFPRKNQSQQNGSANVNQSVKAQKMLGLELEPEKQLLQIPLKATLLSTGIALPSLLVYLTAWRLLDLKDLKIYSTGILAYWLISVRMPIVTFLVFQQNESNKRAISQSELREKRRQVEIELAKMNRKRRGRQNSKMVLEDIELESNIDNEQSHGSCNSEATTRPSSAVFTITSTVVPCINNHPDFQFKTEVEIHN